MPWEAGRGELVKGGSPGSGKAVDGMSENGEALFYNDMGSALMPQSLRFSHP